MSLVDELVLAPFKEIVQHGNTARENGSAEPDEHKAFLSEAQKLIRGAERILKTLEPVCTRLMEDHGQNFIDALKENDDIASYRTQLNNLLWDFEDFLEPDNFDKDEYTKLQGLCKKAGLDIAEILKRMKLAPISKAQTPRQEQVPDLESFRFDNKRPSGSTRDSVPGPSSPLPDRTESQSPCAVEKQAEPSEAILSTDTSEVDPQQAQADPAPVEPPSPPSPPPPPATNPWDVKTPPIIEPEGEENLVRRSPVPESPRDSSRDVVSPINLNPPERGSTFPCSPRRLDEGVDYLQNEHQRRHMAVSPELGPTPPNGPRVVSPVDYLPSQRQRASTVGVALEKEPPVERPYSPPPFVSATILPTRTVHRHSHGASERSNSSKHRSRESLQSSVFDEGRNDGDGSASPAMTENRGSVQSFPKNPDAITGYGGPRRPGRIPTIPPNFPPGVVDGIETVRIYNDGDGLIPVYDEDSPGPALALRPSSQPPAAVDPRNCRIESKSSFYVYKGFCEGAKAVLRGEPGTKKTKKPGLSGSHPVAKCLHCAYDLDYSKVEMDLQGHDEGGQTLSGIVYRMRFLQKSHISTKRSDEFLYGCVFCVHSGHTLETSDATVFFSAKQLFKHLARHSRPLPEVPGITVVESREVPAHIGNNYDVQFKHAPVPSPLEDQRDETAHMPSATVTKTIKKMYGMRLLSDPATPPLELAEGARVVGIEFPAQFRGEWALVWHDGQHGAVPLDMLRLEPPSRTEIRMGGTSHAVATARWKFAPKSRDGEEWLKLEKGELVTSISWMEPGHWCWSGTNSKGKWGIFPQVFIEPNTLKELSLSPGAASINEERRRTRNVLTRFRS